MATHLDSGTSGRRYLWTVTPLDCDTPGWCHHQDGDTPGQRHLWMTHWMATHLDSDSPVCACVCVGVCGRDVYKSALLKRWGWRRGGVKSNRHIQAKIESAHLCRSKLLFYGAAGENSENLLLKNHFCSRICFAKSICRFKCADSNVPIQMCRFECADSNVPIQMCRFKCADSN